MNAIVRNCAAPLAVLTLTLCAGLRPASANLVWGGRQASNYASISTAAWAETRASTVITASASTPLPAFDASTTTVPVVISDSTGNHVVLLVQYADGSVYASVNSDASLGNTAASTVDTITLNNVTSVNTAGNAGVLDVTATSSANTSLEFAAWSGNGSGSTVASTQRNLVWGGRTATTSDRNLVWGG